MSGRKVEVGQIKNRSEEPRRTRITQEAGVVDDLDKQVDDLDKQVESAQGRKSQYTVPIT